MGLTKSERHNRMLDKVFDTYRKHQNALPSPQLYDRFLEIAGERLHISKEEARNRYGQYTVQQWEKLLHLGWNK
jgi:hypothetical protein